MPKIRTNLKTAWPICLLTALTLFLGILPAMGQASTTTKVVFVRNIFSDTGPYKTFLSTTVYPTQTMSYIDDNGMFKGSSVSAASVAILQDADLIIVLDADWGWDNPYTDNTMWNALPVPIMVHPGLVARSSDSRDGWGLIETYESLNLNHGPNPGDQGYVLKPRALVASTSPFWNANNLSASLVNDPVDATYQWSKFYNTASLIGVPNFGHCGAGASVLASVAKGNTTIAGNPSATDDDDGGGYLAVAVNWPQDAATYNIPALGGRRFLFTLGAVTPPRNNLTSDFLLTSATATGKTALQNALLMMYDPQYGRRPTVVATPDPIVAAHQGPANVMVPVTGVTVTNGGTLPDPAISWTVTPAAGFDTTGSLNMNTASPTFHFTADGIYTATVKAQKPNLDYVTASKQIDVLQVGASPTILAVTPTSGTTFTVNFPLVTVTFDQPVTANILVNGMSVGGAVAGPVAPNGQQTLTWTVPPSVVPNAPGPVTFTVDQASVVPAMTSTPPTWGIYFDRRLYVPKIALISNSDPSDDHSAYAAFLTNTVFSPTSYTRTVQIEDIRGKYYNMTPALREQMEAQISLAIVLPYQTSGTLTAAAAAAQWSRLRVPVMNNKSSVAAAWWGAGIANAPYHAATGDDWARTRLGQPPAPADWVDGVLYISGFAGDPLLAGVPQTTPGKLWLDCFSAPNSALVYYRSLNVVMSGLALGNLSRTLLTEGTGPGQTYAWSFNEGSAIARWGVGNVFNGGSASAERCVFQSLGPQAAADNYGSGEVAAFFNPTTGAYPDGGQQVLANGLRWLFNPDAIPKAVTVDHVLPIPGRTYSYLDSTITVVFSEPVSGVLPGDLKWHAGVSGVTFTATAANPQGVAPTDTWVFSGDWSSTPSLRAHNQTITITLDGTDTPGRSHIVAPSGQGVARTQWAWDFFLKPPANVPMWTVH